MKPNIQVRVRVGLFTFSHQLCRAASVCCNARIPLLNLTDEGGGGRRCCNPDPARKSFFLKPAMSQRLTTITAKEGLFKNQFHSSGIFILCVQEKFELSIRLRLLGTLYYNINM